MLTEGDLWPCSHAMVVNMGLNDLKKAATPSTAAATTNNTTNQTTSPPITRANPRAYREVISQRPEITDAVTENRANTWKKQWTEFSSGLGKISNEERVKYFVIWLNNAMNSKRTGDPTVVYEVCYHFQLETKIVLTKEHLMKINPPKSYIDKYVKFFSQASGYLGVTI